MQNIFSLDARIIISVLIIIYLICAAVYRKTLSLQKHSLLNSVLFALPLSALLYFAEQTTFQNTFTNELLSIGPIFVLIYLLLDELIWRGIVANKINSLIHIPIYALITALIFSSTVESFFFNFISLLTIAAVTTLALLRAGPLAAILTRIFSVLFVLAASQSQSVALYSLLLFGPIAIIYAQNKNIRKTLNELKLSAPVQSKIEIIKQTIMLIAATLFILMLETLVLSAANANDTSKVAATINTFPVVALIVAVTIGPIAEEIFFRGFLQPRFGVILTAVAFGVLHFGYGSIGEVIGAFTIGLLFGWWVKYKNSNLWPVILAHALYNLLAITIALNPMS